MVDVEPLVHRSVHDILKLSTVIFERQIKVIELEVPDDIDLGLQLLARQQRSVGPSERNTTQRLRPEQVTAMLAIVTWFPEVLP